MITDANMIKTLYLVRQPATKGTYAHSYENFRKD